MDLIFDLLKTAGLAIIAGFVQNVTGFGNNIVMMLGFSGMFGVTPGASIAGIMGVSNNVTLLYTYRKNILWKNNIAITAIYTGVSIASVWLANLLDVNLIGLLYGIFMILIGCYFIFIDGKIKISGIFWMIFSAVISGIGAGLFSIGGPLMAVYFSQIYKKRDEYITSLQFVFFVGGVISSLTRIINGTYTLDLIKYTAVGIVFLLIGGFFGTKLANKLQPKVIRIIIYVVVLLSGILTVVKYM